MADGSPQPEIAESRHGFLVDDLRILIPRAVRSQYLPDTPVFPVPRASPRLRGIVHWRGQAILAIDPTKTPAPQLPVIGTCNLLLIGPDGEAIGLVLDAPPVVVSGARSVDPVGKPDCWLTDTLTDARVDDQQRVWWEFELSAIAQCMHTAQLANGHPRVPTSNAGA